jgi:hypothetical protein
MRHTLKGLALALVAMLGGCKDEEASISAEDAPEAFAQPACSIYYECGCEDRPINRFSSPEDCELELASALQSDIDEGDAAGLTYHGECVSEYISAIRALGCASLEEVFLDSDLSARLQTVGDCKLFSGDRTAGQSCESMTDFDGDDCDEGLRCNEMNVCVVVEDPKPAGDTCTDTDECQAGLLCFDINGGADGHCETLPDAGDQCKGTADACAIDSFCDQADKTCRLLPSAGSACAPSPSLLQMRCALGSTCENDTCVESPGGGEDCLASCQLGFTCQAGTCVESPPLACGLAAAP